jgi:hypothetical protein
MSGEALVTVIPPKLLKANTDEKVSAVHVYNFRVGPLLDRIELFDDIAFHLGMN